MSESLQRNRYFFGRILSADDFQREQSYFLERSRRHNRFLHGWGIVTGLDVRFSSEGQIEVGSGLAIDCAGNEIAVPTLVCAPLNTASGKLFVGLRYREIEEGALPAFESETQADVIREGFELVLVTSDPASGHRGMGPGTPGCGQAHALCLALLQRKRKRWSLTRTRRRG